MPRASPGAVASLEPIEAEFVAFSTLIQALRPMLVHLDFGVFFRLSCIVQGLTTGGVPACGPAPVGGQQVVRSAAAGDDFAGR